MRNPPFLILTHRSKQLSNKLIREGNSLEFEDMNPLVPIVYHPLMLPWSTNWTDRSIYKPKTDVEGSAFVRQCVSILLKSKWIETSLIPDCDCPMMQIVDIVKHKAIVRA